MKPKQYNKKQLEAVSNIFNLYGEYKGLEIFGAGDIIENKGIKFFLGCFAGCCYFNGFYNDGMSESLQFKCGSSHTCFIFVYNT